MSAPSLLFRQATVLVGGADWTPRRDMDLSIRGGRIVALGRDLPALASALEIPARHLLLLPAFHNGHTHSPEAMARGRAPMSRQAEWLRHAYAGGTDALDDAALQQAVGSAAIDLVRSGTARVTDHFRQIPTRSAAVRAAATAWRATGLGARIAVMLRDRDLPPGVPAPPLPALLDLAAACLTDPSVGLGPSAPQRCTDGLLHGLGRLARDAGSFLHMHVCETAADADACRTLYGESAIAHLDRLGLLGPATELAHCVHVDEDDLRRLAATGTVMVHNPAANLRLGSGVAPVARARALGVRLRLGTDGAGSNDSQSMLDAVRLACLLPRNALPEDDWPLPADALAMATDGARLEPDAVADLLSFDLRAPAFLGATDDELLPRLVLAAREADLTHVLCRGRLLQGTGA
ncbi:MAG: Cytosine/adenosine deaminase [Rhodospirillales bacterium]|nr:Cytosine/adenosine deaminase [Rhodospirillales bacterium]